MTNFWATVEILLRQNAAIVTLFTSDGEWSGGGRIDLPHIQPKRLGAALYEEGYRAASLSAQAKGGRLDRYTVVVDA